MQRFADLGSRLMTIEEYLEAERDSDVRHEYVGGRVFAFAGATETHAIIVQNVASQLWMAARGGPCRVTTNDVKVRINDDAVYYPDVLVVCDPTDTDRLIETRPCLIVEVLSQSTMMIDRREKLIVYQDERRVEREWRDDAGRWRGEVITGDGVVAFPCPRVDLTLNDIYERIIFN